MLAKKILTNLSAIALLAATGLVATSALAGTEDYSKDKKAVIQKPVEPKFYFSLGLGTDVDYRGTPFSENAVGAVAIGTGNGFSPGVGRQGALRTERRRYDSVFPYDIANGPYRIQGEFGYVASRYGEIFGMVKYTHIGSDAGRIGTASFGDVTDAAGVVQRAGFKTDVNAEFDDYNSVGVELGVRLFMLPKESRLRPYVSFAAGATYVADIDARLSLGDGSTIYDGGFYKGGVVATGSLLTGVEFALTKNFSVGAEGGARYEFPLQQRDSDLNRNLGGIGGSSGTTNLSNGTGINNAGDRFYLPFTVYGKVRF